MPLSHNDTKTQKPFRQFVKHLDLPPGRIVSYGMFALFIVLTALFAFVLAGPVGEPIAGGVIGVFGAAFAVLILWLTSRRIVVEQNEKGHRKIYIQRQLAWRFVDGKSWNPKKLPVLILSPDVSRRLSGITTILLVATLIFLLCMGVIPGLIFWAWLFGKATLLELADPDQNNRQLIYSGPNNDFIRTICNFLEKHAKVQTRRPG